MYALFTYDQIDTSNCQNNGKQYDCRRRCKGRISPAVAVKHIINVSDDGVHFGCVKIGAEQSNCVAVGLKCADKTCDNQIEQCR